MIICIYTLWVRDLPKKKEGKLLNLGQTRGAEKPNIGNHGTTMFDELRTCSITIHCPDSHQFGTPLGQDPLVVFRDWNMFFPSALRFSVPEHVNGLRKKQHIVFFGHGPARAWTDSNIQNQICLCVLLRIPYPHVYLLSVLHSQSFPCFKFCLLLQINPCLVVRNWVLHHWCWLQLECGVLMYFNGIICVWTVILRYS